MKCHRGIISLSYSPILAQPYPSCSPVGCDYRLKKKTMSKDIKSKTKPLDIEDENAKRIGVKIRLQKDELERIKEMSKKIGLSHNELIRRLILQRNPIDTPADYSTMKALLKVNGDMGRMGGLLKLWLSDDSRVSYINVAVLYALLGRIESTRKEIREIIAEYKRTFNRRT